MKKSESQKADENQEFLTEEEADNLLKPYLSQLVEDIKNGDEKVMKSEEFFNELSSSCVDNLDPSANQQKQSLKKLQKIVSEKCTEKSLVDVLIGMRREEEI